MESWVTETKCFRNGSGLHEPGGASRSARVTPD